MHTRIGCLLAGTLALTACTAGAPTRGGGSAPPAASARPAAAAPSGKPAASADPAALATAMANVQKLAPAAADATTIRGQLKLDKSYLLGAGGGRAVRVGGVDAVAADGGKLIGNDGATAIANARNQVVVSGAGNVIAAGDARLIGNDGATLIGNDGSTLVGNDGASLVGLDGGTYRLAQAAAADGGGARTPVAGALVGAIDLRSGKPVAIGVDADRNPVFLAYTDAAGGFALYLPPDVAPNVLLVTNASAADKPDARLALSVIAPEARREAVAIDETSALVTAYIRACVTTRLLESMGGAGTADIVADDSYARLLLKPVFDSFDEIAAKEGFKSLKPLARYRAVQATIDVLLASANMRDVPITGLFKGPIPEGRDAFEALKADLGRVEDAVRARLAAEPGWFERSDVVRYANLLRPAGQPWPLVGPGDYNTLMVEAFMATGRGQNFDMVGIGAIELGLPAEIEASFQQAGLSIFAWLGAAMTLGDRFPAIQEALREAIRREVAAARPEPELPAPPTAPPMAAGTARKLATLPPPPPGRTNSRENARMAIVAAPGGGAFVADGHGGRVLHIAADGTASELRGATPFGLGVPAGLALAPDGALYVSDTRRDAIYRIDDPLGTPALAVVAGKPNEEGPSADAVAGDDARFLDPEGLALGPDGALYVADAGNMRVRRIDLAAAARTVTIYAGGHAGDQGGNYLDADDGWRARLKTPRGLAFGPRGLYVSTAGDGRIRLCLPGQATLSGPVTTVAGGYWTPTTGDRPAFATRLDGLTGLAAGPEGRLYLADTASKTLRAWRPDGWITALRFEAGGPAWDQPLALGAGPDGVLLAVDAATREVWELRPGR